MAPFGALSQRCRHNLHAPDVSRERRRRIARMVAPNRQTEGITHQHHQIPPVLSSHAPSCPIRSPPLALSGCSAINGSAHHRPKQSHPRRRNAPQRSMDRPHLDAKSDPHVVQISQVCRSHFRQPRSNQVQKTTARLPRSGQPAVGRLQTGWAIDRVRWRGFRHRLEGRDANASTHPKSRYSQLDHHDAAASNFHPQTQHQVLNH